MAGSTSTNQSNLVVTKYEDQFLDYSTKHVGPHFQFIKWMPPIAGDGGFGGTDDWPVLGGRRPKKSQLSEGVDLTPGSLKSYNVTLTVAEYGDLVSATNLLKMKSRVPITAGYGEVMADSCRQSIDLVCRDAITGKGSSYPTQSLHIDGSGTLASLGSSDTVTYEFFVYLAAQAAQRRIRPYDGVNYVTVVPPLLKADIITCKTFLDAATYANTLGNFDREIGKVGNFRIVESPDAKIFWGAGGETSASVDATLNTAFNAGDTKIVFNDTCANLGITAGMYLTIGTRETYAVDPGDNLEQVQVVTLNPDGDNTSEASIIGAGDGTNMGLAYDHASGEAVVDDYNVASLPIIGQNSLIGRFASETGKFGKPVHKKGTDVFERIDLFGWYWVGGITRVEKNFMRGMVALSGWTVGCD